MNGNTGPLGAQPLARVLELAASSAAPIPPPLTTSRRRLSTTRAVTASRCHRVQAAQTTGHPITLQIHTRTKPSLCHTEPTPEPEVPLTVSPNMLTLNSVLVSLTPLTVRAMARAAREAEGGNFLRRTGCFRDNGPV